MEQNRLTMLKVLFGGMSFFMIYLVIKTSIESDMFNLNPVVLNEPWFKTTLFDFYFNITIISAWMVYKEANWVRSVFWILAFILLGSIATAFYVLRQLLKLKPGDSFEKVILRRT